MAAISTAAALAITAGASAGAGITSSYFQNRAAKSVAKTQAEYARSADERAERIRQQELAQEKERYDKELALYQKQYDDYIKQQQDNPLQNILSQLFASKYGISLPKSAPPSFPGSSNSSLPKSPLRSPTPTGLVTAGIGGGGGGDNSLLNLLSNQPQQQNPLSSATNFLSGYETLNRLQGGQQPPPPNQNALMPYKPPVIYPTNMSQYRP